MSWSGGKDSALALAEVRTRRSLDVVALLTTVTQDYGRVSMHGVRRTLLKAQADALGLPLVEVSITRDATNEEYETSMARTLSASKEAGVATVVFGDLFLEDLRAYREEKLRRADLRAVFPIWKSDPERLARRFIAAGFKALTTCVDTQALAREFVGREFDEAFLADLPDGVDPCGENGEFHSFVYDGPILRRAIAVRTGEKVLREGRFAFCDLVEG